MYEHPQDYERLSLLIGGVSLLLVMLLLRFLIEVCSTELLVGLSTILKQLTTQFAKVISQYVVQLVLRTKQLQDAPEQQPRIVPLESTRVHSTSHEELNEQKKVQR
jgi:hypothetical protein